MQIGFLERPLSKLFQQYAVLVAKSPGPFIAAPLALTAVLSVGLLRFSSAVVKDEIDLYTPTNAQARRELHLLDSLVLFFDNTFH
jgi:hypothetical protein